MLARKAVTNTMWKFMRQYDLLLTPTLAVPPFAVESSGPLEIDGREVRARGLVPVHVSDESDRPTCRDCSCRLDHRRTPYRVADRRTAPGR